MELRNYPAPPRLPTKISVRVLRETFPRPNNQSKPKQTTHNYSPNCPPCHIETQKSIESNYKQQTNTRYETSPQPRVRRRKIFNRENKYHERMEQKQSNNYSNQSISPEVREHSPTFTQINSKTHLKPQNSIQNFNGEQTLKNVSSLFRPPTVKDISPSKIMEMGNEAAHNFCETAFDRQTSRYYSPNKQFPSNAFQNMQVNLSKQSKNQQSSMHAKISEEIIKKIDRLQKSQEKQEKQIYRLDHKISDYYKKTHNSQNSMLQHLNKSSQKLLNQEKQIQLNLITIRDLNNSNSYKDQQLLYLKLELQRSKRVQQLSLQNQKLYQSLTRSQTKFTNDQTYLNNSKNSKKSRSPEHYESFTQNYDTKYLSVKSPTKNIRHNYHEMQSIQEDPKLAYFSNSISALYSPLQQGLYEADDRNDTINQLLSPLCMNPDFI